jgi:hypothetical protein
MKLPKQKKLIKLSKLKKKAEAVCHKYVVVLENGVCFTCGQPANQAGHFCHNRLDFYIMNLHAQCPRCNFFLSGNLGIYAINLDKRYGAGTAEALITLSHTMSNKFDRATLEGFITNFEAMTKDLILVRTSAV